FAFLLSSAKSYPLAILLDEELRLSELKALVELGVTFKKLTARVVVSRDDLPLLAFLDEILLHGDFAKFDLLASHFQRMLEAAIKRGVNHREIAALLHAPDLHAFDGNRFFQLLKALRQLLARQLPLQLRGEIIIEGRVLMRFEQIEKLLHRRACFIAALRLRHSESLGEQQATNDDQPRE